MKRAIFLDRDGVINRAFVIDGKPQPAKSIAELEILPGVVEAIAALFAANFEVVVVTNQPDVARKTLSKNSVENIQVHLQNLLGINHFYTCFHDDADDCECRKPKPGLLLRAAADLNINLSESFMVGDRWRDVAAGQTIGCNSYFIDYSYTEKKPTQPYFKVSSLTEAVQMILEGSYGSVRR